ncbi:tyrosine-type recombinase/integrase [Paenibacillus chartarius]|uniref:Tyrosine-type recombinase/integrase n=1 Tax=Paenibacillus chartarius TaxID=747481 RepID=A0ABV6DVM6_9BACL
MTVKRRQNVLTTVDHSTIKQQMKWEDLVHAFLRDVKARNLSPRTSESYEESLKRLKLAFDEQKIPLDAFSITTQDIKEYFVAYMIDQGKSSNTVNSRIKACKAFFHYLYREGWIKQNLAEELHTVKSEKLMLQTFNKEQVAALLNQTERKTFTGYRDYTMMMVMFETGMRIGELMNLKIGDILFKEQEIRITKGKGGRSRRVPIQKTCCKVLRKYLDIRGDLETDALFVSITNSPLGSRTMQENMQEYGKKAGITGVRVSPHTFRHTMAKCYILNGGDAFTLQKILGHATLDMVEYYLELFSSDIKKQHQKYSPVENMKLPSAL